MKFFQILAFIVVLGLLGERTWAAYKWKTLADQRGKYAEVAASYLFSDTPVKKDGKPLTRAQLLDLLLAEALKNGSSPSSSTGQ